MKKYLIVIKVTNLLTGEYKMINSKMCDKMPTKEDILREKNMYTESLLENYHHLHVGYAKVDVIYI